MSQPTEQLKQKNTDQNGATVIVQELEKAGVQYLFGYPGGAILPIYDALYHKSDLHILVRHEQGAVHAAEGFAKSSGQVGVALVTSGPGATNAITGITDAAADSVPLVVLCGQVANDAIGTNAFQETDIVSMTKPVTKASLRVRHIDQLVQSMRDAFALAQAGRPGPVVLEFPKDILAAQTQGRTEAAKPAKACAGLTKESLNEVLMQLQKAKKPLLLVGGGIIAAHASQQVQTFVQKYRIPVVSSLLGLGSLPSDDPYFIGMAGMHGKYAANMALSQCDFLLNLGSRFDDRLVTSPEDFAPEAWKAHFDIDPHELNKIVPVDLSQVADAKCVLKELNEKKPSLPDWQTWQKQIKTWDENFPYHYHNDEKVIKPQAVIEEIARLTKNQAIIVTDVGQHQMWAAQFYPYQHPRQFITSGGLGTMGFGLPAAIGAKLAHPDKEVVLFIGDGGFQMSSHDLAIIKQYKLNLKIILLNNSVLGMVHQWQDTLYDERHSQTVFDDNPNFTQLANAYGLASQSLKPANWQEDLTRIFNQDDTCLVEVPIPASEEVHPMVLPGQPNQNMINYQ